VELVALTVWAGGLALGSLAGMGLSAGWTRRRGVVVRVRVSWGVGRRLRGRVREVSMVGGWRWNVVMVMGRRDVVWLEVIDFALEMTRGE